MRRILYDAVWLYIILLFSSLHCVAPVSSGGSSSETVIGKVVNGDGSPACSTIVTLYPADYDPIRDAKLKRLTSDTTDAFGAFHMEVQDSAVNYSIVATTPKSGDRALVTDIILKGDTTRTQDAILSGPGAILIPINNEFDLTNGYMYVPGTNIYVLLSSRSDYVILDSVPAGSTLSIHYNTGDGATTTRVIRDSVYVSSNDTLNILYTKWKFSQKLYLNTSSSGADVSGNVYDFPVLIRLTKQRFNFEQAAGNGEDIRFTKTDGSQLPYEIEHWDSAAGKAEIWVKIDTIYANSNRHYFTMIWGNPAAQKINSDGAAVFDTMTGFKGVWHLGEPVDAIVKDQTSNSFNGIANATTSVPGIIGMAQSFNGLSSEISVSGSAIEKLNFKEDGTFSISAWVRIDTLDSLYHGIVYKSNFQYGLQLKPENQWEFMHFKDKSGWEMSRTPAQTGSWLLLTGVRDGLKQLLYVNGSCVDSSIITVATSFSRKTDQPLEIGHCPDGGKDPDRFFKGIIDEVRIAGIAYSPNWIKLCYLNQKEEDKLLNW
jgi:hypothetical protein